MRSLCVWLMWALSVQSPAKLFPVDEAPNDTALENTRSALLEAVRVRNASAFMSMVSQDVSKNGMDVGGWEALNRTLGRPLEGSGVLREWDRVATALALGGAFTTTRGRKFGRREFCAPYVYAAFPKNVPDHLNGETRPWVIVKKEVQVRERPGGGTVTATLSYDLVRADGPELRGPDGELWQEVEVDEKVLGFVPSVAIRNPEGYHVCLANEGGRWMVSTLGDTGALAAGRF